MLRWYTTEGDAGVAGGAAVVEVRVWVSGVCEIGCGRERVEREYNKTTRMVSQEMEVEEEGGNKERAGRLKVRIVHSKE